MTAFPQLHGLLLNIGGDVVVRRTPFELGITDPANPYDNAEPLSRIVVADTAVATSGRYARGLHFVDARTGKQALSPLSSATVAAPDAVTANALATALCIASTEKGIGFVEKTAQAAALLVRKNGVMLRTSRFPQIEKFQPIRQAAASTWPVGFEVAISLTLTTPDLRLDRPYVAFWIEDMTGRLVRTIALWGNKPEYHPDMLGLWGITGGDKNLIYKITRATRSPGAYKVVWNGLDDSGKAAPQGSYRIVVETNRYRGTYAKASGVLPCGATPSSITLEGSVNFSPITIQYGPRPTAA